MFKKLTGTSALEDWVPTDVHHWEGKEENVLVLNYTLTCPLSCDFCCYNCHPKRTEKMPIDLAKRLIREAAALKSFSSVGFTGGEPMVYLDEIIELGELLYKNHLPFTIATAGHWADTPENADQIIGKLNALGLLRLNISHDPSHAKFVPSENIVNAAKAAEKHQLPLYLIGTFYATEESIEKLLPEIVSYKYVNFINKYVAKVGRAERKPITQTTYDLSLELDSLCCYRRVNHDISIFYDGEAYPCCSTFNRSTDGISLGNANKLSLETIWERAEGSISLRIMKRQGFGKLYEIIQQYDLELYEQLPKSSGAVGPCSLCNHLFSNIELTPKIKQFFEQYEIDKIDKTISYLIQKIGMKKTLEMIDN